MTTAVERAQYYQRVSSLYTNNGWDRVRRHYTYLKTPDMQTQNGTTTALGCISLGAFTGAGIGLGYGLEHNTESAVYILSSTF